MPERDSQLLSGASASSFLLTGYYTWLHGGAVLRRRFAHSDVEAVDLHARSGP